MLQISNTDWGLTERHSLNAPPTSWYRRRLLYVAVIAPRDEPSSPNRSQFEQKFSDLKLPAHHAERDGYEAARSIDHSSGTARAL